MGRILFGRLTELSWQAASSSGRITKDCAGASPTTLRNFDTVTEPEESEKPKVGLSQILLVAMTPILVVIAIPLNVFLGQNAALTFVAIALPLIIVTVLLLSRAEKKKWSTRD